MHAIIPLPCIHGYPSSNITRKTFDIGQPFIALTVIIDLSVSRIQSGVKRLEIGAPISVKVLITREITERRNAIPRQLPCIKQPVAIAIHGRRPYKNDIIIRFPKDLNVSRGILEHDQVITGPSTDRDQPYRSRLNRQSIVATSKVEIDLLHRFKSNPAGEGATCNYCVRSHSQARESVRGQSCPIV